MESYYSSDEEIAWGPLTLKEIKKELKKEPKKIQRRETDFGCYSFLELKEKTMTTENNNTNISGTSAYFTPNESFQPDSLSNKNDLFLEKLTKVIEGEANEVIEGQANDDLETSYETALDVSKMKCPNDTIEGEVNEDLETSHGTSFTVSKIKCLNDIIEREANEIIEENANKDLETSYETSFNVSKMKCLNDIIERGAKEVTEGEGNEIIEAEANEDLETSYGTLLDVSKVKSQNHAIEGEVNEIIEENANEDLETSYETSLNVSKMKCLNDTIERGVNEVTGGEGNKIIEAEANEDLGTSYGTSLDVSKVTSPNHTIEEEANEIIEEKANEDLETSYETSLNVSKMKCPNDTVERGANQVTGGEDNEIIEAEADEDFKPLYGTSLNVSKMKCPNDTIMKILNSGERFSNKVDNIHLTLVDNTYIQCSPCGDNNDESIILEVSDDSDDEVIVISDDSSNDSVEHIHTPVEYSVKCERHSDIVNIKGSPEKIKKIEEDSDSENNFDLFLELQQIKQKMLEFEIDDSKNNELKDEDPTNKTERNNVLQQDYPSSQNYLQDEVINSESDEDVHSQSDKNEHMLPHVPVDQQEYSLSKTENKYSMQTELSRKVLTDEEKEFDSTTEDMADLKYMKKDGIDARLGVDLLSISESLELTQEREPVPAINSSQKNDIFFENPDPNSINNGSALVSTELDKSKSFVFNDTLEELERYLNQGLDYCTPKHDVSEDKKTKKIQSEPAIFEKPTGTVKKKPIISSLKNYDYIDSPVGNYIRKQKPPVHENFKLPALKPLKTKLTPNIRSPQLQTRPFKNIYSPIGVYIKNSPGVCLKKNVSVKTVPNLKYGTSSEMVSKNKENITNELPPVIYKPPKKIVSSVKKDVNLPPNIEKLVPEPTITKHQKRLKTVMDDSLVQKKLLEDDLTATTVDGSLLNNDISFVTVKQAFIK